MASKSLGGVKAFAFAVLAVMGIFAALPASVHGQLSTASINGTVKDATGSLIPEALVVLRNADTSVERNTQTNSAGNYVFLNISPGTYTLETSKTGFSKTALSPFTLVVNQTATFDFNLSLGSVQQSVTVEAIGAEIQSSTAELGAAVTRKQVDDLPLNGRDFTQLLSLAPGVAPVSVSQNSGGWTASPVGQFVFPAVNGQTNRSNFFMMDGGHNQGVYVSSYAVPPIIDAIQEFKVQSHNDQAEFGGATGGIVNVVTKSGTNQLHGTAWEFIRNDAFDARNRFLAKVTPFKQNMFGATAGGPVVLPKIYNGRNKTFFFLGYQGFRYRSPAQTLYRVPTEANLQGDLSDWPNQIYNPFSTRVDPAKAGSFIRDPFPGNQIPGSLIDPGMVLYAKSTLPAPVVTGVTNRNALDATPFRQDSEEYTARVDQTAGSKDFFWFRYSGRMYDNSSSGGRESLQSFEANRSKNIGVSWVHTFSPSTVLQVQFTDVLVHDPFGTRFRSLPADFAQQVGLSDQFAGHFIGGASLIPDFSVPDYWSGGEGGILKSKPVDIKQGKANLSRTLGNHTLKLGGEWNTTTHFNDVTQINVGFSAFQTSNPESAGSTGSALASFLMDVPDSAGRRNTHDSTRSGTVWGLYLEDQWRLTSKLTVNIGLRYDRTMLPAYGRPEDHNEQVGSLDLSRGVYLVQKLAPSCDVAKTQPCIPTPGGELPAHVELEPRGKIYHDWTDNWQPRVGLAYRLGQNTAIRASFGIFFESWAAITQSSQNYSGTWPTVTTQLAQNLNNPQGGQLTPSIKGTNPFPSGLFPDPTPFNQVEWYQDPYAKNAYSMQWNIGIQQQLNSSTVVTANYVGSGSRRLDIGGYYNVATTPGPGDPTQRAPFPYIASTFYDRSWGRSNYNSFQFLLDKKYSSGLAYMVAYTWSKAIDIGCSGWYGVEGCAIQDPYHLDANRSVAGFDLTQVLSVNWVYGIPVGKGKLFHTGNRLGDYLLGNWQFNGIALLRSGLPYTVGVSGDIANTGNSGCCDGFYERLNLIGNPQPAKLRPEQWLNGSAFAPPDPFTFGSLGRNTFRTDWFKNVDLSVFRQFPITETKMFEIRVEAFNAFNVTTFGQPVNNFSSPDFGRVFSTSNIPRQLQFAAKIRF